jgi:hypothetical protein
VVMNKKLYEELKIFFLELLTYIKPNMNIDENTPFGSLKLEDIDFTLIAIECEDKYQIMVDEKVIATCFFIQDAIDYLANLLEIKNKTYQSFLN